MLVSACVTRCGERGVALDQSLHGIGDLLFGEAAHFSDHAGEILQIDVEGLGGVIGHDAVLPGHLLVAHDLVRNPVPAFRDHARLSRSGR